MDAGGNQYGNQSQHRSTTSGCSGQITCYELDVMLNCYGVPTLVNASARIDHVL